MSQTDPSTRVAIVTGAARGIGAAVALRLATDGMAVGLLDLDGEACDLVVKDIRTAGGQAIAVTADVVDVAAVENAVARVTDELDPPTVLVNNAGITRDNLLFRMSPRDWDSVMELHLREAFLMTRAAQGHMLTANFGRIVNLSSGSALGNRGQANYAAAKAGLQGFTKTLALELGRFGVTANAVAPGFIETEMTAETAHRVGSRSRSSSPERPEDIPVGRTGTPDDIAHCVSFFASPKAGFVSGQVMYVAGGPRG